MEAVATTFRTIVDVADWEEPMRVGHRFVLLGSCFAQNMGERFRSYGLDVICNPLGVTYNPESIRLQVRQALTPEAALPVFRQSDAWHCWWTGTLITASDESTLRAMVGETFSMLGDALRQADFLFITLGTNVCYRLRENGLTVANCHKAPGCLFDEVAMSLEECIDALDDLLSLLVRECPKLRIVLTVSPYRYKKYGYHGSQLAKATLLLAVEEMCRRHPDRVGYFPAYELVLDDLRDYRFYADDMIHPSSVAVDYIWERLVEHGMDGKLQQLIRNTRPTTTPHIPRKCTLQAK